jgi:hypothetical protein
VLGQVMLGHELVRGDARLVLGDDLISLFSVESALELASAVNASGL